MHPFPHVYHSTAKADPQSTVTLSGKGLPSLVSTPPPEFGGPEGNWSPETLLTAAVADCFILTFNAIARGSKLEWTEISCDVKGTVDRVEGVTRFTRLDLAVALTVPEGTDTEKADRILHKSEGACLVTASLSTENHLETEIRSA